jgi:hypothetical protein
VLCLAANSAKCALLAVMGGDPRVFNGAAASPLQLCDGRAVELLLTLGAALACFLPVRGRKRKGASGSAGVEVTARAAPGNNETGCPPQPTLSADQHGRGSSHRPRASPRRPSIPRLPPRPCPSQMYTLYHIEARLKLTFLRARCGPLAPHDGCVSLLRCHALSLLALLLASSLVSEQAAVWGAPYACD